MTGAVECRYYGRDFTAEEMTLLRALIADPAQLSRRALSIEFCRRIGWLKPDGGLKDMMARVTMLAMHRDGLIELPPPRWQRGRAKPIVFGPDTEPPLLPAPTSLDEVRPLQMRTVVHSTREGTRRQVAEHRVGLDPEPDAADAEPLAHEHTADSACPGVTRPGPGIAPVREPVDIDDPVVRAPGAGKRPGIGSRPAGRPALAPRERGQGIHGHDHKRQTGGATEGCAAQF